MNMILLTIKLLTNTTSILRNFKNVEFYFTDYKVIAFIFSPSS